MTKCAHCKQPSNSLCQWTADICADKNRQRVAYICADCDVELNALVLKFLGIPNAAKKAAAYKAAP